jgi:PAS domain S-box-containing protein
VLIVGSATPWRFTEADLQLLQRAAERIALAIDRARLYAAERDARRQAEARAERLNTILENIADGVTVYDADGHPIQSNRAYRELLAVEQAPAAFEAMTAFERVRLLEARDASGTPLPLERALVRRALQGDVVTGPEADTRVRAFDGREVEVNNSAAPLREPDGRIAGAVLVMRDMTERNQLVREREAARVQAEQQAEQLDLLFEGMADGLLVYDAAGTLIRTNAAARQLLGLEAAPPGYAELPVYQRLAAYALRDAQDHPLAPQEWPTARALRGESLIGAHAMDLRLRTLDGRDLDLHVSGGPLWDRAGHLIGAVAILHDQTAQRRAEAALRASEERYRGVIETQTELVCRFLPDSTLTFVNEAACRSAGKSREELLGSQFLEALPDAARGLVRTTIQSLLAHPGDATLEHEFFRPDGTLGWQQWVNRTILDDHGQVVEFQSVGRDITERRQLEQEREQAQARELAAHEVADHLDQFFATASHDIRSPVTALIGNLQMARVRAERLASALQTHDGQLADLATPLLETLSRADESGDRLLRLVPVLFDLARARTGTLALTLAPCNLVTLLREQVTAQQTTAPSRTMRLDLPDQAVTVIADADRIGQVVTNYLTNALKYSADDQPVEVRLEATDGLAVVAVRDHGPGLPPDEHLQVWERYHRAPGVEVRGSAGASSESLGLGLHICKQLIELHPGGAVGITSAVGKGSTFWFRLPLAAET